LLVVGTVISGLFYHSGLSAVAAYGDDALGVINCYRDELPKIVKINGDTLEDQIAGFLLQFSPLTKVKQDGKPELVRNINRMLNGGRLNMVIKGFPFKSTSSAKCIGSDADLFDYLALMTLNHIAEQISTVHGPGAHITIVNDGLPIEGLLWP
jgi:hypothetical protein